MVTFMPRMLAGSSPSARAWNIVDAQRAALGTTFTVTRVGPLTVPTDGTTGAPSGIDLIIPWTGTPTATRDDMWEPAFSPQVVIREPGTYLLLLAVRWAATAPVPGGYGGSAAGLRYARIMCNGTAPASHTIVSAPPRPGSLSGFGVTTVAMGMASLRAGDILYSGARHTAGVPVTSLNTDAGGTYMSVTYLGPGGDR